MIPKSGIFISTYMNSHREREDILIAEAAKTDITGLRVEGYQKVYDAKFTTDKYIVGLKKRTVNGQIYTTSLESEASQLALEGADMIAVDYRCMNLISFVHDALKLPVMVDVADISSALKAMDLGADIVSSTFVPHIYQSYFIEELNLYNELLINAEGGWTPETVPLAKEIGADWVTIGAAVHDYTSIINSIDKGWVE